MTEFNKPQFNETELTSKVKQESVIRSLNPYRNQVIEEVARKIETMQGFGQDTIASFAIFIRGMKE